MIRRRSIRLKDYDYSRPGMYFVTVCTNARLHLFGEIVNGKIVLNDLGKIARRCWLAIPHHFPQVELDEFVIMPNHVHGIIVIKNDNHKATGINKTTRVNVVVGAKNLSPLQQRSQKTRPPRGTSKTIGSIVRGFKIGVTKWARQNKVVHDVWQRNYYEHIIHNVEELRRIRQYIRNNPTMWESDNENPEVTDNMFRIIR